MNTSGVEHVDTARTLGLRPPEQLPEYASLAALPRVCVDEAADWIESRLTTQRWLVTLDGRSGSGKTVLSTALLDAHPQAQVLHLDDLYRDWDRLPSGVVRARHMAEMWRRGESPSYRPTQWPGTPARAVATLDPRAPLIVEGCGATWVGRRIATTQVWLDVDRETRRTRALRRDGETFAPFWLSWEQQETQWYHHHAPHPDVVVTPTA